VPHESEPRAIHANPGFVAPGRAGKDIDLMTMMDLKGYQITPNSPCIDKGISIFGHGERDFFGNRVHNGKVDLGAVEYQP
jgi:hypothetical protein